METKQVKLDRETFCCSICLDLLKDPVTIPCGHSYCMNCIKTHWDGEDEKEIYSCPQCRETFTPRPVLVKNTMLADLVEELKKSGLPAAPADHCYAGPDDVACDVCSGRKLKATKSCLICLVSYCDEHLQPHYQSSAFWRHTLMEPSKKLQENICSHQDDVMHFFYVDELEVKQQNIQQRIQDRDKYVKRLQRELEAISRSADETVEDSEKMLTKLIRLTQKQISEVKQQVRSQQKTEVSRVKEFQEKLQQEITELKRKEAELKKLSHKEDHSEFLQNYSSVSALSESTDSPSINIRPLRYFEDVTAAVSEVRDKLQDVAREKWKDVLLTVSDVDVLLLPPEPRTRAGFLKCSREITLDPNTANKYFLISEGDTKATAMSTRQFVSHDREVFYPFNQVLSREGLTGRCYWEVELGAKLVFVAVAYRNMRRNRTMFGNCDKSWAILHSDYRGHYVFSHKNVETPVSGPLCSRIGVYLDHSAGILSFYSVSDTMTLLHRVQTTFTQPLHAGLMLGNIVGASAWLCKPE
ncbi:tripartite motif-containing protein 16-like [Centropristis striata]|uniref:tripartite motif-containing protein 16-like n=1 Tax=Centropristis striata TaxID=184440 RepID=UPI0027E0672E|nr:tripartite motif-containing protein 16-like [Centropristis striata]